MLEIFRQQLGTSPHHGRLHDHGVPIRKPLEAMEIDRGQDEFQARFDYFETPELLRSSARQARFQTEFANGVDASSQSLIERRLCIGNGEFSPVAW